MVAVFLSLRLVFPSVSHCSGYNGKSYLQHVYALDTMTGKWNVMPVSGQQPPPMCGAATVMRGSDLFVFGQSGGSDARSPRAFHCSADCS